MDFKRRLSNLLARLPGWTRTRLGAAALGLLLCFVATRVGLRLTPLPAGLFANHPADWEFLDRTGQSLRSQPPEGEAVHHHLDYSEIPQRLVEATVAAEDRRFWIHHGVDWRATTRAACQLVRNRRIISGGSTITQQLIKLAEPRPRTFRTKLIEAAQAMRLEQVWTKQRILAEYLDRLDYGEYNRGCAAAARYFFGKPLADLSSAESALLAGLPQAPTRLNPNQHPDRARKREQWVLEEMLRACWLTPEQYDRARTEPLRLAPPRRVFEAPHFVDLVISSLPEPVRRSQGRRDLGPIRTSLDLGLNQFAEQALNRQLNRLQSERVSNGAAVVLDNRTGEVLALVGSRDYFSAQAGQVNGAWSPRSTGSALKPFTYLLALEKGGTPASIVADVPTDFATATGLFTPVNYDHHCLGPVRYRSALANSLNISAVKVLSSVGGAEPLRRLLQDCGLTTLRRSAAEYGLGLTIGNSEARLLELANAYASLARLGVSRPFQLFFSGGASPSDRLTGSSFDRRVADPGAAYLVADMLADNDARTPAFGPESALRFRFPVACKTGTSSDFRDNWAFGYTPEFTVGVWVGNFDGSPMRHVSGVTGAAPILHELFDHLHERFGTTWYDTPAGISEYRIHPVTGHRLTSEVARDGMRGIQEKFLAGSLTPWETEADYAIVADSGPKVQLGAEYRDWFNSGDNWLGGRALLAGGHESVRIAFPLPGTRFFLDPDLPQQGSRLSLRAEGARELEWTSESLRIQSAPERQTAIMVPGRHTLTVRDRQSGDHAETWIEVEAR